MSAFEKLPREVRDLIYEHCLLYDGEIIPFPNKYERQEVEGWLQFSNDRILSPPRGPKKAGGQDAFLGYPYIKREALQTVNRPCVALLGVNSTIRDEAASILFGKNVWRISSKSYVQEDKAGLWETYAKYFRYVVTRFDACDVDEAQLLDISMEEIDRVEEDFGHFDQTGTAHTHLKQLSLLKDGVIAKRNILHQMNLKSLSFDFWNTFCPIGCCRREALQSCLICLGSKGPWYKLGREQDDDLEIKQRTDVNALGLKNDEEKKLFWETWGLKVD